MNAKYALPGLVDAVGSLLWMQVDRYSFSSYWWVSTLIALLVAMAWMVADGKAEGGSEERIMREHVEMQLGEWFVRLFCKLIALGAAICGAGGFAIIGMRTILPLLDDGRYVETACAAIACVAVLYGLTPLALAVDGSLLHAFGMEPLKGLRQDPNQER